MSNSPIKIKVCGMSQLDNILAVNNIGLDYMGFIFFQDSKRFVGKNFVLPDAVIPFSKRIGVFVNENVNEIIRLSSKYRLMYAQLHGDENIETCSAIKATGIEVIKAFAVDKYFNFNTIKSFTNVVDYFLFDTKGAERGGNGIAFDWTILNGYPFKVPYFLSGGISTSNIEMVKQIRPYPFAIDLNSGVEKKIGLKDVQKISQLKSIMSK